MLEIKAKQSKIEQNSAAHQPLRLAQDQREAVIPIKAAFTQFEVINAIYDSKILSEVKLTAGARLVLISLARHYNPSNDEFFPSYSCIASHTGVSKKSVERAIKELVGAGLITYRTEKVNRYRFTGRFFASVNLSVHQRQNDGCDRRQNDELTNKHEKINNNKNILNFSLKSEQSHTIKSSENKEFAGYGLNKNSSFDFNNVGDEEKSSPARQNDGNITAKTINDASFAGDKKQALNSDCSQSQFAQTAYYSRFSASVYAKNRTCASFSVPQFAQKGGSSFTPSVSTTEEYLKTVRQARSEACSPLDFDFDAAKHWYYSLNEVLRQSTLARKVAKKFGF